MLSTSATARTREVAERFAESFDVRLVRKLATHDRRAAGERWLVRDRGMSSVQSHGELLQLTLCDAHAPRLLDYLELHSLEAHLTSNDVSRPDHRALSGDFLALVDVILDASDTAAVLHRYHPHTSLAARAGQRRLGIAEGATVALALFALGRRARAAGVNPIMLDASDVLVSLSGQFALAPGRWMLGTSSARQSRSGLSGQECCPEQEECARFGACSASISSVLKSVLETSALTALSPAVRAALHATADVDALDMLAYELRRVVTPVTLTCSADV